MDSNSSDAGKPPRRFFSSIVSLLQPGRHGSLSNVSLGGPAAASATNLEKLSPPDRDSRIAEDGAQRTEERLGMHEENLDRRRYMNTLPAWVHSLEEGESTEEASPHTHLIPANPDAVRYPHHNYMPIPKPRPDGTEPEMAERFRDAMNRPGLSINTASRWQAFARSSAFPRIGGEIVSPEWLEENMPDKDAPWIPADHEEKNAGGWLWFLNARQRAESAAKWDRFIMRNPFVPLIIRLWVITFCAAALALGAWIYHESAELNASPVARAGTSIPSGDSNQTYICQQQASTYMAFIVNSFAVLYLFYITWDEYFSKPLGQRRTRAKLRLIFLDLFFIVFSAADLSLAFNTMIDQQWSCYQTTTDNNNNVQAAYSTCVYSTSLCNRQKALVSMLLVAQVAWVLTFTISVLRVVERLSS